MKKLIALSATLLASAAALHAQALDWPTAGADAQRSGWEKSDPLITKEDVAKKFQMLWKIRAKSPSLMAPVILGRLIGYRGFKELAFIGGSDDSMYVQDVDMNRLYWQTKLVGPMDSPAPTPTCPGGMTAMATLLPQTLRRGPRPAPGTPPPTVVGRVRPNVSFGGPRSLYVISSDGMFRRLNVANGNESGMTFQVVPANSRVSTLNVHDGVIYATTSNGCGGAPNAVWAIDFSNPDTSAAPVVKSLATGGSNPVGIGGPVIGTDGTVYVQTGDGPSDPANGKYANTLLALTPETLVPKGYFQDSSTGTAKGDLNAVTPVIFDYKEKPVIVNVSRDGRLNLLDASSFEDHKTILAQSPKADGGFWGGLTSWADASGTRFVLGTVWHNASGSSGSVTAYKLEEKDGKPTFTPAWTVKDLVRPVPPVIASGVAFILSSGEGRKHAVLHAVDGTTGSAIWSTKNEVTGVGNLTPLTVANGRVYFVTADSTVWVFGISIEI